MRKRGVDETGIEKKRPGRMIEEAKHHAGDYLAYSCLRIPLKKQRYMHEFAWREMRIGEVCWGWDGCEGLNGCGCV